MVVGAADMKTMVAGPPPKTRISSPSERGAKASEGTAVAKKSPMMAIAAGVVILAAAGGGYAVFGRGKAPVVPPATPVDTSHTVRSDSTPTVQTPDPVPTNPGTRPQQHTTPTTTPTNPHTTPITTASVSMDPIDVRQDLGRMLDASDNADKASLDGFITRSERYYRNRDLPQPLRAQAAAYEAQFYLLEAKLAQTAGNTGDEGRLRSTGKDWARNAADMDSKWQSLLSLFD